MLCLTGGVQTLPRARPLMAVTPDRRSTFGCIRTPFAPLSAVPGDDRGLNDSFGSSCDTVPLDVSMGEDSQALSPCACTLANGGCVWCAWFVIPELQSYEGHQNFTFEDKFVQLDLLGEGSFNIVHQVRPMPVKIRAQ